MNKEAANSKKSLFEQLSKRYLLALSVIAGIILFSQWLIQNHLYKQINDSRVVNVAGRQRMLSQKLSKEILKINQNNTSEENTKIHKSLKNTLDLWVTSHEGLKHGSNTLSLPDDNSPQVVKMFDSIQPHFDSMVGGTHKVIDLLKNNSIDTSFSSIAQEVLTHENDFLEGMNSIVFQYDFEAKKKLESLRRLELFLFLLALLALLLELLFIFRPTASYVQETVNELTTAEQKAYQKSLESAALYEEKQKTVQELRALNFAVDQAALFASINLQGDLIYMSDKLSKFLGYGRMKPSGKLANLFTINEGQQDYLTQIIKTPRSTIWIGEVPITTLDKENRWLELSIVPVNRSGIKQAYLILCNDITERKETALKLEKVSQERIEEEIRLQKMRSSQIVEAQEKERERIAREMHDGIGQKLTALKFNLEALNPNDPEKLAQKIEELKTISTSLIKGVRIATFNLTPPELADYGITTALSKLCKELQRMTGENVLFINKAATEQRYDSIIETNIYRITQEAVNNAIKYAKANYIIVTFSISNDLMSVKIDDDGIGFDPDQLHESSKGDDSAHMGLSFMQERVEYIDGRLFINSAPSEGTRITINVPVK